MKVCIVRFGRKICYILVMVLFILPNVLKSQENYIHHDFSIGINVSSASLGENNSIVLMNFSQSSNARFGYFFAYDLGINLSKRFLLKGGLKFEQSTYNHSINGLIFATDVVSETKSKISSNIQNLDLSINSAIGYKINGSWRSCEVYLQYNYIVTFDQKINSQIKYGDGNSEILSDKITKENYSNLLRRNSVITGKLILPLFNHNKNTVNLITGVSFFLNAEELYLTESLSWKYSLFSGIGVRF